MYLEHHPIPLLLHGLERQLYLVLALGLLAYLHAEVAPLHQAQVESLLEVKALILPGLHAETHLI
jgi:hypothetical protein